MGKAEVKNLSLQKDISFLRAKCMDLEGVNKGLLGRNSEMLRERAREEEGEDAEREGSLGKSKFVKPKVGVKAGILKKVRESVKE